MSPERLRSGGASPEDDVYAMALTLWEMWTCRVPEPGYKPRAKTMRSQIMFDVPAGLSIDEVKQIFRGMNEDPQMRPQARHMRFFNPTAAHHEPHPAPARAARPGPAARPRSRRRVHPERPVAARHLRHQRARGGRHAAHARQAGDDRRPPRRSGSGHPRGHGLRHPRGLPLAAGLLAHRGPRAAPTAATPTTTTSARRRSP